MKVGESKGGRKPILLSINSKSFYVIGLDIGGQKIRAILTDLNAEIEENVSETIEKGISETELMTVLKRVITTLIGKSTIDQEKIIGIGIGMHGMVDHEKGIALFAPNLQLTNIPLKKRVRRRIQPSSLCRERCKSLCLR
ncbi:MAG: ROK family protein [Bacillaceae bacterium]|nr:ROK family protein [Bacillaceae bacterium]